MYLDQQGFGGNNQPIIENSVKHGLRSKLDGGTITITVSQDTEYFFSLSPKRAISILI